MSPPVVTERRRKQLRAASRRYYHNQPAEWSVWCGMKRRCYCAGATSYPYYGALGVKVCDRWLEPNGRGFRNFLADMGPRPSADYDLSRLDDMGDYAPENCIWQEQSENRAAPHRNVLPPEDEVPF